MLSVVLVLFGVLSLVATSSVNYCGARMCGNKNTHTYCQYPKGPSPKCVGYENVKLRSREKLRILKRLNSGRNKAAAGGLPGFPPAGNMMKLHWVEELARLAQRWADQCRPPNPIEEHDTCRDLYSLTVGQCVASVISDRPVRVDLMIDVWNRQSKYYNHSITSYVPPSNGSRYYGDFAQLYWAKSYMVGCAHSQFQAPWKGVLRKVDRLVCNLAPAGPQLHRRIWNPSAPTELCPYRGSRSSTWFNLCDYPETVRELQEGLERNERTLSRKKGKHRKVLHHLHRSRRSKRDKKPFDEDNYPNDAEGSGYFEKFLNTYSNTASCVTPSFVIVIALCL